MLMPNANSLDLNIKTTNDFELGRTYAKVFRFVTIIFHNVANEEHAYLQDKIRKIN